jgi:hypothetical protein
VVRFPNNGRRSRYKNRKFCYLFKDVLNNIGGVNLYQVVGEAGGDGSEGDVTDPNNPANFSGRCWVDLRGFLNRGQTSSGWQECPLKKITMKDLDGTGETYSKSNDAGNKDAMFKDAEGEILENQPYVRVKVDILIPAVRSDVRPQPTLAQLMGRRLGLQFFPDSLDVALEFSEAVC